MQSSAKTVAVGLTIAGSDSSGGAGIQADLKTFAAFGIYGASVITALTAQNTQGVRAIADLEAAFVARQMDTVAEDLPIAAAKTGMLSRGPVIEVVVERLLAHRVPNLVVDPVMVAASGDVLLEPGAISLMRDRLLPLATVITPNLREAEILTGRPIATVAEMEQAAIALVAMGARAAMVKGGRLASAEAIDVLCVGKQVSRLSAPRAAVDRVHGAGCTLSAAIAAGLALGNPLPEAVATAKRFVTNALRSAPRLGRGATPLNHLITAR